MNIDFVELDLVEFHDLPVKNLVIHADPIVKLEINVLEFNEKENNYNLIQLTFSEFKCLNLSQIELNAESDIEIHSFEYLIDKDGFFNGKITFLIGFGKLNFITELICKNVKVTDLGVSE